MHGEDGNEMIAVETEKINGSFLFLFCPKIKTGAYKRNIKVQTILSKCD